MTNSPGPSTSRVESNDGNESSTSKNKKRTRRKPRTKKKDLCEEVELLGPKFVIEIVKQQSAVVYKHRDKKLGPINLQSYTSNGLPCVFYTKKANCDKKSSLNLLKIIKNSIKQRRSNKSSPLKKNDKTPEKKSKKKERIFFSNHMSQKEIKEGLERKTLVHGFIRINPKKHELSYVGNEDLSKADYVLNSLADRNRALDGDEVIIQIDDFSEEQKKVIQVVAITQRIHPRLAVGYLEPIETPKSGKNKEFAMFIPRDRRFPRLKIPKISWPNGFQSSPELYTEILFVAKITDWREVRYGLGVLTESLGISSDLKVQSVAILREFCLDPTPYGDDVRCFLPKESEIPPHEFTYRRDLRKECIFTIDPLTARDLDDAVSCKKLPNGNFEVGVHISDASFYLQEYTKLDAMVRKKATTIYMVDSVYHMLPVELCLHCSLLPGQDKLAFSVIWELTPEGEIVAQNITRSVINSCCQLAYEHAQMMIDDPGRQFTEEELPEICNDFACSDLSEAVNHLQTIAVCLRDKRKLNGSLKIDQVKISFSLDPTNGEPTKFWIYENKPAHRLIEEFMLLANMSVAKFINEAFPDLAFLRLHEPPKPTMMIDLQENLETVGIHLDISSSGGIQASLDKYAENDCLGRGRMLVLSHLLAKPMKRARYFCAGALDSEVAYTHFALSIPIYTHFTSPIRRYADIMVHRLLAAALHYTDRPTWVPEEVAFIAETCNRQKYAAKRAGDASCDLYLAHYVESHQPCVEEAVVVDSRDRSFDVIVPRTGSVIRLYANSFPENIKWKPEEIKLPQRSATDNAKKLWKIFLTFPKTPTEEELTVVIEMFTLVRVELSRKPKTSNLEAKLLRPLPQNDL